VVPDEYRDSIGHYENSHSLDAYAGRHVKVNHEFDDLADEEGIKDG
jgi:hypothetical protein